MKASILRKPLKGTCGSYHTDSDFDVMQLSKTQVNKIARDKLKRNKIFGCKRWWVLDKGDYWSISIC